MYGISESQLVVCLVIGCNINPTTADPNSMHKARDKCRVP